MAICLPTVATAGNCPSTSTPHGVEPLPPVYASSTKVGPTSAGVSSSCCRMASTSVPDVVDAVVPVPPVSGVVSAVVSAVSVVSVVSGVVVGVVVFWA